MHFFAVSLSLLFAASTLAYQINEPSGTEGWSNSGPNTISWERVDTDPMTNRDVLSQDEIILASLDGTLSTMQVNPPDGGWPIGRTFRINFVQDSQHQHTILAQSSEFNITSEKDTIMAVTTDTPTSTTGGHSYLRTSTSAASAANSGASAPGSSSTQTTPASATSNAALPVNFSKNGLIVLLALLGAILF
ncbi:uncharacterized protein EV420DRAFT_1685622 [Desarmillaria tabescens]|uniref:Ser-Thr-rich glycosyl-phosphatidyl-inositol-anchored membrane family-domain-containing protein n=1 Tax=Armillaria tabescens TaxID=1929756 RepID=A0AA39NM12_ARMTA|nr:uncharacterized protein EV420DRAFT_1685622 [Desarmillaria tabescens]KAK0468130.1 hypothetical protein EV420DRAFT_1685622 [Desarmillaria tabescens]